MPRYFRCIVADPPWNESGGGRIKRGADRHYRLLKWQQIVQVMCGAEVWRPGPNCHLWLWVTNNYLQDGLRVMKELGFRYVTNMAWVKEGKFGLGQYLRGQHELLLFGVRGRLPSRTRSKSTVVHAPRGNHSEKPHEAYATVEAVSLGPRLEMFARRERRGWTVWGDQV